MPRKEVYRDRVAAGRCGCCGQPRDGVSESYCGRCLLKYRVRQREQRGCAAWVFGGPGRPPKDAAAAA